MVMTERIAGPSLEPNFTNRFFSRSVRVIRFGSLDRRIAFSALRNSMV
jgi:hypothetical protein